MTNSPVVLLSPAQVLLDLRADDEAGAIRAVAGMFAGHPGVTDAARLADEVIDRERLSSTALGCGVAFPHARTGLVTEIVVAAGRSVEGVRFAGSDDAVHFVFVIGTPPDRAPQYLALVGTLARLLRTETARQELLTAPTPDAFVTLLRSGA